ncbi:unnamed protein product [Chrysoparadoxa australica]
MRLRALLLALPFNLHSLYLSHAFPAPSAVPAPRMSLGAATSAAVEENIRSSASWEYDWREHWYPVGFEEDFPKGSREPWGMSIFDEPLALFRDGEDELRCVQDLCPHRLTKLSEGKVFDGNIECQYHGWQMEGKEGKCVRIPQLEEGAVIPKSACVRTFPLGIKEGIVWVWMGTSAITKEVPCSVDDLDTNKDVSFINRFVVDLPYDHSYLLENLLDQAHIPISHDATSGGGSRDKAKALKFEVDDSSISADGFKAKILNLAGDGSTPTMYNFDAPCVIRVRTQSKFTFGGTLHCIPVGQGRSRLLFMTYILNAPAAITLALRLKPKFLLNLNACKILEQDLKMITAQEDHFARTGQSWDEACLPISGIDPLVVEYRKWLDKVGQGMPWYEGWTSHNNVARREGGRGSALDTRTSGHRGQESRYWRHVRLSTSSKRGLRRVNLTKKVSAVVAVSAASAAAVTGAVPAVVVGVGAVAINAAATRLEQCFYVNFERFPIQGTNFSYLR